MIFISYQPTFKKEGSIISRENLMNDINIGDERVNPILNRDKEYIDYLGYNPYWASGGNDSKDIILQSLFSEPNTPSVLHIFETHDYVKINKIIREQCIKQEDNNIEIQIDKKCNDVMSEFLVRNLHGVSVHMMVFLDLLGDNFVDIRDIVFPSLTYIPDFFIEQWNDIINKICKEVPHCEAIDKENTIIKNGLTEKSYDYIMNAWRNKFICEMAILPVLLQIYFSKNERNDGRVALNTCHIYKNAYTWRELFKLKQKYEELNINQELNENNYMELIKQGRNLIIDDFKILTPLMDKRQIYPNDRCPCGSGQKYKKCHGKIISQI